jgi:hypothetical protein
MFKCNYSEAGLVLESFNKSSRHWILVKDSWTTDLYIGWLGLFCFDKNDTLKTIITKVRGAIIIFVLSATKKIQNIQDCEKYRPSL